MCCNCWYRTKLCVCMKIVPQTAPFYLSSFMIYTRSNSERSFWNALYIYCGCKITRQYPCTRLRMKEDLVHPNLFNKSSIYDKRFLVTEFNCLRISASDDPCYKDLMLLRIFYIKYWHQILFHRSVINLFIYLNSLLLLIQIKSLKSIQNSTESLNKNRRKFRTKRDEIMLI